MIWKFPIATVSSAYAANVLAVVSTCDETFGVPANSSCGFGRSRLVVGHAGVLAPDRVGGLAAELDARDERVAERAGVELEGRVELVLEEGLRALGGDLVARHLDLVERRLRRRRPRQARLGDAAVAVVAGVAGLVADRDVGRELVREADRAHVGARVEEGAVLEAVVVGAVDRRRLVEVPGDAVVGDVPGGEVEVRQSQLGRAVEAERDRRRDAPAAILRDVAAGDVVLVAHGGQLERRAGAERGNRLVDVGRDAVGLGRADEELGAQRGLHRRELRRLVDDAARGSAAELRGGGSLEDFDLLEMEGVAVVAAEVAHPVDVDVVARREAAQREGVALEAALARGDRNAGHVAQRFAQRRVGLLLHELLRDDADGLGRVEQRLRELRRDVEGRLAGHDHGLRRVERQLGQVGGLESEADGRADEKLLERDLDGHDSGDAGGGDLEEARVRNVDLDAGSRAIRLEHGAERTGGDLEPPHGKRRGRRGAGGGAVHGFRGERAGRGPHGGIGRKRSRRHPDGARPLPRLLLHRALAAHPVAPFTV